jgi:hypothetical protein
VGVERRCADEIWVFSRRRDSGSGEVGEAVLRGLLCRVCERVGLRAKERQVVVARRQDCREESASALSWGEQGHRAGS